MLRRLPLIAVSALLLFVFAVCPRHADAANCPDYLFLGATGSGGDEAGSQPLTASSPNDGMGRTVFDLYRRVTAQLHSQSETSSVVIEPEPVDYPATGVGPSFNLLEDINGTGALIHIGPLGDYHDSVLEGTEQAIHDVNDFMSRCGSSGAKVILSGYSQGAQALADAIQGKRDRAGAAMDTSGLVGAAFFGDPYFNPRSNAAEGDFDPGRSGVLGTRGGYPASLMFPERRIHSFCRNKDPICQGLLSSSLIPFPDFDTNRHKVYRTEGSTETAAVEIENLIRDDQATRGNPVPDPLPAGVSGPLDVVFAIDTTGSMGDLIGSVKADVQGIVSQLATLDSDYRVALVDYKDAPPYSFDPYQAEVDQGFTSDESAFDAAVEGLFAEGGEDTPESVYTGMMTGLELPWRNGAHKVLVAIGDAGGHWPDPVTGYTGADVIAKSLSLDPVAIYGLVGHGSGEAEATFSELAEGTGGETLPIESAEEVPTVIHDAIASAAAAPSADAGGPYTGYIDGPTLLSAAASVSPLGRPLTYEWDTDDDGIYDLSTEEPVIPTTWTTPYEGSIELRVTDSEGLVGLAQTSIVVNEEAPAPPSAPTMLSLAAGDGSVTASWQRGLGGGTPGYYILRDFHEDPVAYVIADGARAETALIAGLPNGVPIALSAAAVNVSGESRSPLSPFVTPMARRADSSGGARAVPTSVRRAPAILRLRESARRWRLGTAQATTSDKGRARVGTVFSFSLDAPARVTFEFTQILRGSATGHRCALDRGDKRRGRPACQRQVSRGALTFSGHVGTNRVAFQGHISRRKQLGPGAYALAATATDAAGLKSKPQELHFTIIK